MSVSEIYLDHAASTVVRAEAQAAWTAAIEAHHANPTGAHKAARDARRALDDARDLIASLIDRPPAEVVFTSGGLRRTILLCAGFLRLVAVSPCAQRVNTMPFSNLSSTLAG